MALWRNTLWSAKSHGLSTCTRPLAIPQSPPGKPCEQRLSGWSLGKCEILLGEKAPGRGGEDIKTAARTPSPASTTAFPGLKITPNQPKTIKPSQSSPWLRLSEATPAAGVSLKRKQLNYNTNILLCKEFMGWQKIVCFFKCLAFACSNLISEVVSFSFSGVSCNTV